MSGHSQRLNGWKAIGSYFGRDRTTAIRWERERNLPVRRTPGGKVSTVYAYAEELDRWLEDNHDAQQAPTRASGPPAVQNSFWPWLHGPLALASALLAMALVLTVAISRLDRPPLSHAAAVKSIPADPETAAIYLRARRDWARRQSQSIDQAIAGFGEVISRDPSFAPAYSGLADAYILAREFGSLPDAIAFRRARAAATVALDLSPNLASAHRAKGFVQYWWENNPVAAGLSFRRALQLVPNDSQTHHWYGTALTDNGDFRAALRELDAARSLNPESDAIQADWAYALWSAGRGVEAERLLTALARDDPNFVAAHDCLRDIYLADRNFVKYLEEMSVLAAMRREPAMLADIEAEQAAYREGGIERLRTVMLRLAIARRNQPIGDRAWTAAVASAVGNRQALVMVLREAVARGEKWGAAGQLHYIASAWADDGEIQALLTRSKSPPMEP